LDTFDGSPRRFPHGQAIVRQGDPASSVCVVLAGAVRLSAVLPSGREVVVGLLGPGEVFGEAALLGGGPSPVEARAVGEAQLVTLTAGSIDAVIRQNPATAAELLRLLAARLHRTSAALEEALAHDVPTRVSRRLVELARTHGVPHPNGVRLALPLTQEDIGRMVGASRESVNKCLGGLVARGLVRIDGRRYVIPDPDALARAAGAAEATIA
jgi:CRP/FNR family transcriptional regulator